MTRPKRVPYMSRPEHRKRVWKTPGGYLHRWHGPAIEEDDGSKWWFLDGTMSRVELVPDNPRYRVQDLGFNKQTQLYDFRIEPEQ
jgi:hypothetical protein